MDNTSKLPFRATIKKDWTPQKLFDTLIEASEAGSFPSVRFNELGASCYYRNGDKTCAFGIFVPDEQAHHLREGDSASSHLRDIRNVLDLELPDWLNINMFDSIQLCHDNIASKMPKDGMSEWPKDVFKTKLNQIFKDFKLEVKVD